MVILLSTEVIQKTGTLVDDSSDEVMLTKGQGEGHPLQLIVGTRRK